MKKIFIYFVTALFVAFGVNTHAMEVDLLGGVDIHGFVSQGYMQSQDNNYLANDSSDGTFAFNEIGINFSKQLTDQLRIGLQLFSRDLGAIGNNDIVLDWAFADYRWKDWLGVRAGKIKLPNGLYNETRDLDMLRTSIFLPQGVYSELERASRVSINGLGIYGSIPINALGSLSYYLLGGTFEISGDDDNGVVRQSNSYDIIKVSGDFDVGDNYIGALEWQTPLDGLLLKITYNRSEYEFPSETVDPSIGVPAGTVITTEIPKQQEVVYSIEYTWNNLLLASEYMSRRIHNKVVIDMLGLTVLDDITKMQGYYFSASYRFNDWFEAGAYYSKFYPDADDKDGSDGVADGTYMYDYQGWLEDIALSLRFDINEYWICKVEGHLMDGAAYCLALDNDDFEEDWYMFAAKLTFSF